MIIPTILLLVSFYTTAIAGSPTIIIRVRTTDGSVLRVPLPEDDASTTLASILTSAGFDLDGADDESTNWKCRVGPPGKTSGNDAEIFDVSPTGGDRHKTAADLGLKHGSMITILPPTAPKRDNDESNNPKQDPEPIDAHRFDPFPDLAKSTSFSAASRRARAISRGVSRGMSYGDISRVHSTMHAVEHQQEGPLTRVYVCRVGAAKFQSHCLVHPPKKKKSKGGGSGAEPRVENRVGLLFGTINKERVDQSRKVARTSLSTPREDQKMCEVAKVHAVWEPPLQSPSLNGKHYDEECLLSTYQGYEEEKPSTKKRESATERALRVAGWLGLRPVGWIFSYADEDRHEDGDALPVHGRDAAVGAKLQIETMKRYGRDEGRKFITLALDGRIGATEAFQLSDVCVQMVAENVLSPPVVDESLQSTRFLTLKDPVVVSGEETKKLDSVLLLVNTAMLSHVGSYSGGENAPIGGNVKRSNGALLVKTKTRILTALQKGEGELEELCDFDILMALDAMLCPEDSEQICAIVKKFARGQRKGTALSEHLKLTLLSVLGG
mmetsp:Transcript_13753/g.26862  ORF Transcript_13753/g.26862 Transcript_13753/m.26862 type:complete len:553 (-) Transcript_13753:50-1708(-)